MTGSQALKCLNDLHQLLLTPLQVYDKEYDVNQMLLAASQQLELSQSTATHCIPCKHSTKERRLACIVATTIKT